MTPQPSFCVVDLITSNDDRKFAPAGRMAAAIIEIVEESGACLPQDLNAKGFTPAEVAQHWHMAKALADVELKLAQRKPGRIFGGRR
ncbi:hypothetical protein JQ554_28450 [Bradyrhizobium diazoefficiens]|nr:hypothetical protein [Bradyrhizobium diazoefficiens]MBR0967864.1 hypothetical protein [Bradyrhizobium diazoefficiens]MBR0981258.1 hypothetical protein [Bradyrhizobium diazoefficiens]MBR1010715.1 hypothetical protein [Bradyrhizobium diazoefficiens]MBR1015722.1 hypothetical protein [Bradyrhizobium diazoefficiens]MBR1054708.1 hypothetical protein [Bradyrhizobium diazoefficiens]